MIQLAFEPAFDPFHAVFRVLRQIDYRAGHAVTVERIKMIDVYVAEPIRCLEIRLSGPPKKAARLAAAQQPTVYGQRPSTPVLFSRMSPMQDAAIQTLVLQGLLDADAYGQGKLLRGEVPIPENLASRISNANADQVPLMSFLCTILDDIAIDGPKGLKSRTGLGEFRYDLA